jgi:hypothetical protein
MARDTTTGFQKSSAGGGLRGQQEVGPRRLARLRWPVTVSEQRSDLENAVRDRLVAEIVSATDVVQAAPRFVYESFVASLAPGGSEQVFVQGILEGLLLAADIASAADVSGTRTDPSERARL